MEEDEEEFYSRVFEQPPPMAAELGSHHVGGGSILRDRTRKGARRKRTPPRHITLEEDDTINCRVAGSSADCDITGEKASRQVDRRRKAVETFEWISVEAEDGGGGDVESEQVELLKKMVYKLSLELRFRSIHRLSIIDMAYVIQTVCFLKRPSQKI